MKLLQFTNSACKKTTIFQVFDKKTSKTRLSNILKIGCLPFLNDCFKNESNAVSGVFLQRLNRQHNAILNKFLISFLLVFSVTTISAQDKELPKVAWKGYTQLRFSSNFNDINSFAMRRMKFWINSAPGFSKNWGFKVQTTMTSYQNEKFLLQDVLVNYRTGNFIFTFGQFNPHYSLQRFQHDYKIPLTERAGIINALIPNGTLGVRDIGIETEYSSPNKILKAWFGVFNGNGIKEYRLNNQGIMLTQKTDVTIIDQHLRAGYSLMYRKADQLQIPHVLPDSVAYSGNDVRFNLFTEYKGGDFHIQAEYLWASLNNQIADGWYVLAQYNINKNQISASWNQYNDLIASTSNSPVVQLGYNYSLKGDKLKLMLDNGFQIDNGRVSHYLTTIQIQLFFN